MLQKDLAETQFTAIIVSIKKNINNVNESFNSQFKVMENCMGQL